MLFNSIEFLLFFPAVAAAYFLLPHRFRWMLLLAASYWFYMSWRVPYALLLITTTLTAYVAALRMPDASSEGARRGWLAFSLVINLGLLFTFKYFNLFADTGEVVFRLAGAPLTLPHLDVLLPVGISFYTFQTLSYSIDVYRGERPPERHLGLFSLYVAFFPQLVAGPIERSTTLLPQLHRSFAFDYWRVTDGLKLMAWGFFKKLVIADRLAVYVDNVYTDPSLHGGATLAIATVFFAYQIYCDFSGYSDIAIGASRVLGYDLMQNFRQPYFARSIREFWRCWHISLSTWFRDYLYIPLGGNRASRARWYWNLFIVFVISGLWHGANWTFVAWGALHGLYLVCGLATEGLRARFVAAVGLDRVPAFHRVLQTAMTMGLVLFAWIFFRANDIGDAYLVITRLLTPMPEGGDLFAGVGAYEFWVGVAAIFVLEAVHLAQRKVRVRSYFDDRPAWVRWTFYYAGVMSVLLFAKLGAKQFIYFQF